jgi:hypothetical protein
VDDGSGWAIHATCWIPKSLRKEPDFNAHAHTYGLQLAIPKLGEIVDLLGALSRFREATQLKVHHLGKGLPNI